MRKSLLIGLVLIGVTTVNLRATTYAFENFETSLFNSEGISWDSTLNLQLGGFLNGFTPTTSNRGDWLSNWASESGGYYDPSGPEWAASLTLGDNSIFTAGSNLYLWAFDVQSGASSQQALFFDAAWLVAMNDPLDPHVRFLSFGEQSGAILGMYDSGTQTAFTAASAGGSAVPEPSTYGLIGGLGLALCALRKSSRLKKSAS